MRVSLPPTTASNCRLLTGLIGELNETGRTLQPFRDLRGGRGRGGGDNKADEARQHATANKTAGKQHTVTCKFGR